VAVKKVSEAQTLANFINFPMMFLDGEFVPLDSMPVWLRILACLFPLANSVESLRSATAEGTWATTAPCLGALAAFNIVLFLHAVRTPAKRNEWKLQHEAQSPVPVHRQLLPLSDGGGHRK
jgi:ABC-2 type transport system permease protein